MANMFAPLSSQLRDEKHFTNDKMKQPNFMSNIDALVASPQGAMHAIRAITAMCKGYRHPSFTPEILSKFLKRLRPRHPEDVEPRDSDGRIHREIFLATARGYVIAAEIYLHCRLLKLVQL